MVKNYAKPFLKWAGGKRQLLGELNELYPTALKENKINRYVEPFLGGGAVFFDLISKYDFEEVILNDINKELIWTYRTIKERIDDLITQLKKLEKEFFIIEQDQREEFYYNIRETFNKEKNELNFDTLILDESIIIHSANFIFLNRTCFNGLYRENKRGYFNVPFGKYVNPKICDEENLLEVSDVLQNVVLRSVDFEELEGYADESTLFYLDPPYRPLNKTSSFKSYSKDGFNDDEQIRLGDFCKKLHTKDCLLILSNSNPKNTDKDDNFFIDIYNNEDFLINEVMAGRAINSKGNKRGKISELIIVNY